VATGEVGGGVVAHQDLAAIARAPDEDLQRQIQREQGRGDHERRAGLGTAENEELRLLHLEADPLRRAAVVDQREHVEALLPDRLPKTIERL